MAKVLACPSCGHKHRLDLLVGLDTFVCSNCDRKLAVPQEANSVSEVPQHSGNVESVQKIEVVARSTSENVDSELDNSKESTEFQEARVVAKASEGDRKFTHISESADQPVAQSVAKSTDHGIKPKSQTFKKPSFFEKFAEGNSGLPVLGNIGKIVAWILAVPTAFFIVVIVPRFFGTGFRASYFLNVITQQGLGRFRIVILLIVLWSVVSVACLYVYMNLMQRFLRSRLKS